jgi:hypothetical protein
LFCRFDIWIEKYRFTSLNLQSSVKEGSDARPNFLVLLFRSNPNSVISGAAREAAGHFAQADFFLQFSAWLDRGGMAPGLGECLRPQPGRAAAML